MTVYGYARVSSAGQTLVAQHAELHKAGASKVYREKLSGAAGRRPQLEKLLRVIREGDVVLVTRLDRLARSTRDLLTRSAWPAPSSNRCVRPGPTPRRRSAG